MPGPWEEYKTTTKQAEPGPWTEFGGPGAPQVGVPPNLEELRAARVKTASPQELRRIHFGENVLAGGRAMQTSQELKTIPTLGAAGIRAVGSMVPFAPLASEPAAQLFEVAAGEREQMSPRLVAGETALSMVPGSRFAKSAITKTAEAARIPQLAARALPEIAERLAPTAARRTEQALIGEAASALPAITEGKPYTPGIGAITAPVLGAGVERGAAKLAAFQTKRRAIRSTNQILAGLDIQPTNQRGVDALDKSVGQIRAHAEHGPKIPFRDTRSFSNLTEEASQTFFERHHKDIVALNDAQPVIFKEEPSNLLAVVAERERLNKRLHRYSEQDPATKAIMEEVNPKLKEDVADLEEARSVINTTLDQIAPQNASQADMMRTYSHMLEISGISKARANEVANAKRIAIGKEEPLSAVLADVTKTMATFGLKGQALNRAAQLLKNSWKSPTVDADAIMRRAGRRFRSITPAPKIRPQFKEPLGEVPSAAQAELPFAPPGVGAMGAELPLEQGPPRAIQVPNKLTQQFSRLQAEDINRPDVTGQTQLPFVAPQVGEVPGTLLPARPSGGLPPISGGQPAIEVGPVPTPAIGGGERRSVLRTPEHESNMINLYNHVRDIAQNSTDPAEARQAAINLQEMIKERPWLVREAPNPLAMRRQAEQEAAQAAAEKGAGTRGAGFSQEEMDRFLEKTQAPTRRERFWAANYRKQYEKGGPRQ